MIGCSRQPVTDTMCMPMNWRSRLWEEIERVIYDPSLIARWLEQREQEQR